jgi:hypothetical protein
MAHLLVLGIVAAAALLLLGADRVIKARSRARHLQAMSERLSAATARVDRQQEKRHAEEKKGAALTSVMPAIKRPPLSLPGVEVPDPAPRSRSSREHPAQPDRGPGRPARHSPRAGERVGGTGDRPSDGVRKGHQAGPRQTTS